MSEWLALFCDFFYRKKIKLQSKSNVPTYGVMTAVSYNQISLFGYSNVNCNPE